MSSRKSSVPSQPSPSTRQATGLLVLNRDILYAIVRYCLSREDCVEIPPTKQSQQLILCQICHSLRRLILASPKLWTRFSITSTKLGQHRDLFREWLNRADVPANSLPISIENVEESRFSVVELEEFVLPHSSRLFRLHLYLTYEALEWLFNLTPSHSFPCLSIFQAECTDFQQPSILSVEPVFLGSPLKEFALNLGPPVLVRGLGILWAGLRVLRLTSTRSRFFFPISWLHTILDACRQSLETCFISLEPTTDPDLPRLELPFLKNLSIHFRDPGWKTQAGILGFLSLPSLASLEFSCQDGLAFNEASPALKSFFHRSPVIHHLRFERTPAPGAGFNPSVNSSEVVNILTLLSNLRTVQLPNGHYTNIVVVLDAILLKKVCPLLETMELAVNNGLQVLRAIQVLWREAAGVRIEGRESSLRSIRLIDPRLSGIGVTRSPGGEDPEIIAAKTILRELKEEGLMIHI